MKKSRTQEDEACCSKKTEEVKQDQPKLSKRVHYVPADQKAKPQNVVSQDEWEKARQALLEKEKELTREYDKVVEMRRQMPWKKSPDYVFKDLNGKDVKLSDLFVNPNLNTLIVQHLMMGPNSEASCPSCCFWGHGFNGQLQYVQQRANFVLVAKAQPDKLKAFVQSQHWNMNCVSCIGNSFNADLKFESADGTGYVDGQNPGLSVFVKGDDGTLYQTYEVKNRGYDLFNACHSLLDLTPCGRQGLSESLHSAFNKKISSDFFPTL